MENVLVLSMTGRKRRYETKQNVSTLDCLEFVYFSSSRFAVADGWCFKLFTYRVEQIVSLFNFEYN